MRYTNLNKQKTYTSKQKHNQPQLCELYPFFLSNAYNNSNSKNNNGHSACLT